MHFETSFSKNSLFYNTFLLSLLDSVFILLKEFFLTFLMIDKEIAPKTVNDLKLINAGRISENNRTLAESRVPVGEVPGGVITMQVVVRPLQVDKNSGIADNFIFFLHMFPGSIDDLICSPMT